MSPSPLVSIVIPHYDERELLRECLEGFAERKYDPVELIVVDNGSSDGSKRMVRKEFPSVELVEAPASAGIGRVNNLGLQHATGDVLAFDFNNDEVIEPGWIQRLVTVLQNDPDVGIVSGLRLRYADRSTIDSAGVEFDRFGKQTNYSGSPRDRLSGEARRSVDFVEVPVFHRELLQEIGTVDEEYYFYAEDADFCLRAKRAGYDVVVEPTAVSYHRRGASIEMSPQSRYYSTRARIRLFLKNFHGIQLLFALTWWWLLRPVWAGVGILLDTSLTLGTRVKHISAMFRALAWNVRYLRQTLAAR
jgi:GT2 family glycosyltransferase